MARLTDLTNVLTTLADNDLMHAVDVSDTAGSAEGTSGKIAFSDLKAALGSASNTIVINAESDFPAPVAGVITLESGKNYLLNNVVVTANRFVIPLGGFVRISSNNLSHALVYVGGGTMFTGSNFSLFVTLTALFQAPGGVFFDFEGAGSVFQISTIWTNCVSLGSVRNNILTQFFCQNDTFTNGFVFESGITPRAQASLSHTTISQGSNALTDLIKFTGTDLNAIAIQDCNFTTSGANESILNLDESLKVGNTQVVVQAIFNTKAGGNVFAANSLDQKYNNAKFYGCVEVPDSTVSAKITLDGNTAFTTITVAGQNEPIALNSPYVLDTPSFERFLVQDLVSFDFTTNTLTTVFVHNLSANDRVFLHTYTGIMPTGLDQITEYYVIAPGVNNFKLSLTSGGPEVDFTDNGSGVIYYRHMTGNSFNGELIYIGLEDVTINISGWNALTNIDASDNEMRSVIMKIDLSGNITQDQVGSRINADSTKSQSSVNINSLELVQGEGLVIYHRNESNTDNISTQESIINLNRK